MRISPSPRPHNRWQSWSTNTPTTAEPRVGLVRRRARALSHLVNQLFAAAAPDIEAVTNGPLATLD